MPEEKEKRQKMKITKGQLKTLISETISNAVNEAHGLDKVARIPDPSLCNSTTETKLRAFPI